MEIDGGFFSDRARHEIKLRLLNRLFRACILFATVAMWPAATATVLAQTNVEQRIDARKFPSVFLAWSPADNLKNEDPLVAGARHDLAIVSMETLGLRWNNHFRGMADGFEPSAIAAAREIRAKLLKLNPNAILIAAVQYRDAAENYLPDESPWWKRKDGGRVAGWEEGHYYLLDFSNPEFRAQVVKQARAMMATGVFDGIFLDWWKDDDDRLALVRALRSSVNEKALILANVNDLRQPLTAPFINGYYMECYRSATPKDWRRIANTLRWAEKNLRQPRVNCVETWFHKSRQDLNLMRATTTLALTMSDGYCLFGDPDSLPTPDHLHDWYDFWDKRLGRPLAPGSRRTDGSWERDFECGTAVYNPMGNGVTVVRFKSPRRRLSNGETALQFDVSDCDGDIFLLPPADTSRSGP